MVKADNKFEYEDEEGNQFEANFTNFDLIANKLDLLTSLVNEHSKILSDNGLQRKAKITTLSNKDVYENMFGREEEQEEEEIQEVKEKKKPKLPKKEDDSQVDAD